MNTLVVKGGMAGEYTSYNLNRVDFIRVTE